MDSVIAFLQCDLGQNILLRYSLVVYIELYHLNILYDFMIYTVHIMCESTGRV